MRADDRRRLADFRLDHVIVFVNDLTAAERACERLGLQITSHATHPGFGTRNAAIAFGLGFVELLTEAQPADLRASRYGRLFLERHARGGNGPAVFVFKAEHYEEVIAQCRARGGLCEHRQTGYSQGPDGVARQWEAAMMPGTEPVYLDSRLPVLGRPRTWPDKTPGNHPLGALRIDGVVLAVRDLDGTIELYRRQLGLEASRTRLGRGARVSSISLGNARQHVIMATPDGAGSELANHLSRVGDGIFAVLLQIENLDRAEEELRRNNVKIERISWLNNWPVVDSGNAAGCRFMLSTQDAPVGG